MKLGSSKNILQSKTFGLATANLLALKFIPGLSSWAQENLEVYVEILTVGVVILRYVTTSAIHFLKRK